LVAVLSLAVANGVGCSDDDNKNNDGGVGGTGGRTDAGSTGGAGGFGTGGLAGQGGKGGTAGAGGFATGGTAGTHTGGGGAGAIGGGGGLGTGGAGGLGGRAGNGGGGTVTGGAGGVHTGGTAGGGVGGGTTGGLGGTAGTGQAGAGGAGGVAVLSDGQITAIMLDANSGEVRTANIANTRSSTMAIRDFAVQLSLDHGSAIDRLNALSRTLGLAVSDSPQRQMVATQGTQIGEQLWAASSATFDQTFLQAQVTLHTSVLNLLDNTLLPAVQADEIKMELQTERTAVAQHLAHAQTLLAGGTPDAGTP
jgi:predicted outer membrane protein